MKDCRDCKHSTQGYGQWLCTRMKDVMATSWRRDQRNECGPDAKLFESKETKK